MAEGSASPVSSPMDLLEALEAIDLQTETDLLEILKEHEKPKLSAV